MRKKEELLPIRDCEAGYGPGYNTLVSLLIYQKKYPTNQPKQIVILVLWYLLLPGITRDVIIKLKKKIHKFALYFISHKQHELSRHANEGTYWGTPYGH